MMWTHPATTITCDQCKYLPNSKKKLLQERLEKAKENLNQAQEGILADSDEDDSTFDEFL